MQSASQHGHAYGVKYQARCIAPQLGDSQSSRFLVGTQSLRDENEVHVIQLPDNSSDIVCEGLYIHHNEIWDLAACPFDKQIISTVHASVGAYGVGLWKLPDRPKSGGVTVLPLQQLSTLDGHAQPIKCTLWWPAGKHQQLLSIDAESLFVWDLDTAKGLAKIQAHGSAGELHHMAGGAWDPHDVSNVATIFDSSIQMWDLRSMRRSNRIEQAHAVQVRDIDFNPKKSQLLVTAGDDSKVRIWDMKMPRTSLAELPGHAHWTWRVKYNPKYDELILSSGTDYVVNLWRSSSSPQSVHGSPKKSPDPFLQAYTEHEDSVYGIAWSSSDPWVFASLSYDGRVIVDVVPQSARKNLGKNS
ncbi:unnamed protein product [Calypogeia fissa]